jgi:Ca2+-binding EF-hand superfamily protein
MIPRALPSVELSVADWDLSNVREALRGALGAASGAATGAAAAAVSESLVRGTTMALHRHMLQSAELVRQEAQLGSAAKADALAAMAMDFQTFSWGARMLACEAPVSLQAQWLVSIYGQERPGRIWLREFQRLVRQHPLEVRPAPANARARNLPAPAGAAPSSSSVLASVPWTELQRTFRELDRDRDGFLTMEEFERMLVILAAERFRVHVGRLLSVLLRQERELADTLKRYCGQDPLLTVDARGFRRSRAWKRLKPSRRRSSLLVGIPANAGPAARRLLQQQQQQQQQQQPQPQPRRVQGVKLLSKSVSSMRAITHHAKLLLSSSSSSSSSSLPSIANPRKKPQSTA